MADLATGPDHARFVLRGRPDAVAAAGSALGFALPQDACRAASAGARHALWLGPDEWLILAPTGETKTLFAALESAMAEHPHALVDVSARQVGLALDGPDAETTLAVGCPLDLDIAAFPIGMCTRTVLAKAQIVLWRTGETMFHLEVWRSFAAYVRGVLQVGGATVA